jgi:predicted nucleic acid-binding protein
MYLLDTNVISELRRGKPNQSATVRAWAALIPVDHLFLSAITMLELEKGVLALERRTPPQGSAIRAWLSSVRVNFASRILPFTGDTAILCAAMDVPNTRPERDAMIAATAQQHGMIVVTRNRSDFGGTGVSLLNPLVSGFRVCCVLFRPPAAP